MRTCQTTIARQSGRSWIEILAALGAVVLLIAFLYPVCTKGKEKARQASCAANMHQIGLAMSAYSQDYDCRHPVTTRMMPFAKHSILSSMGWAGQIYPYVKSTSRFRCPDDMTEGDPANARVPVSYAVNSNLTAVSSRATLKNPAKTVLLFEVLADRATVTLPDEGIAHDASQVSAAGNGVNEGLLSLTGLGGPSRYYAIYATGPIDNHGDISKMVWDQYQTLSGRHAGGSNFLAADGHVQWLVGMRVSAGASALSSSDAQFPTGCNKNGSGTRGDYECAEGTANGTHALTFSVF